MDERTRLRGPEKEALMLLSASSWILDTRIREGLGRRAARLGCMELMEQVLQGMDELVVRMLHDIPETDGRTVVNNVRQARISCGVARIVDRADPDDGVYISISDLEDLCDAARSVQCFACPMRGAMCKACRLRKLLDRNLIGELPEIDGCPYRDGLVIVQRTQEVQTP